MRLLRGIKLPESDGHGIGGVGKAESDIVGC